MYSIFAGDECIYLDASSSLNVKAIDPKLTMSDNSAGSLEFTLPANNARYDTIKRLTTDIIVKRDSVEIWAGRVFEEEKDFYNNRKIYCEGELAFFNDSIQPPAEYHDMTVRGMLERFVAIHNQQAPSNRQFTVGVVTVTDPNDALYRYTNYETTMACLNDKLLKQLGGHFRIRKVNGVRTLDYLADYPNTNSQQINIGRNLLDYSENYNMEDFVTVLVPRGEQIQASEYSSANEYDVGDYVYYNNYIYRCLVAIATPEEFNPAHWTTVQKYFEALTPYLTVEEVNSGSPFVQNAEAVANYGRIVKVMDWPDVTDANNLKTKAQNYLSELQFDNMVLTVTALDLHYLDVDIEAFNLLDQVRVISHFHGVNRLFPITELQIPMDNPEDASVTMGTKATPNTLSESLKQTNDEVLFKLDNITPASKILDEATRNATGLITMATNGYVTLVKNQNGTSELLITDEIDYTRAHRVWRWNINGLGYSNNGYNGPYGTAITMDGSIVANYITSGTMFADRIKGGTLEVGGSGAATNGSITVKDINGITMMTVNRNGLVLYDENGVGKAYMDHTGLTISQGTINGATINAGGSMGGSFNVFDGNGRRIGTWDTTGLHIEDHDDNITFTISCRRFSLDSSGSIYGHGKFTADGDIETSQSFRGRAIYCAYKENILKTQFGWLGVNAFEHPTPYYGDIGEGILNDEGECFIYFDDMFLEFMENGCQYQVFLQAYGEGNVYIADRKPDHFVVKGTKGLRFGWEAKVVQKGMCGQRFDKLPYNIVDNMERSIR